MLSCWMICLSKEGRLYIETVQQGELRRGENLDLAFAQKQVKDYLAEILKPEDAELSFWRAFSEGNYQLRLLFDDTDILTRIEHHPMAQWKSGSRASKQKSIQEL